MICEHVRDIKEKYNASAAGKEGDAATDAKKAFVETDLFTWFDKLEKCASLIRGESTSLFLVGESISLADIVIHNLVAEYFTNKEWLVNRLLNEPEVSVKYPHLVSSVKQVSEQAKDYLATRKVTTL